MPSGWAKKEATTSALESSTGLWIDTTVMLTSRHRAMHFGSAPACVCAPTVTFQRGACFSFDEKNDRWAATIVALYSPPLVSTFQSTAPDQHATFFFPWQYFTVYFESVPLRLQLCCFFVCGHKKGSKKKELRTFSVQNCQVFLHLYAALSCEIACILSKRLKILVGAFISQEEFIVCLFPLTRSVPCQFLTKFFKGKYVRKFK